MGSVKDLVVRTDLHSQNEQESVTQQAREARHFLQAVAVCKDSFTQANTAGIEKCKIIVEVFTTNKVFLHKFAPLRSLFWPPGSLVIGCIFWPTKIA